MAPRTNLIQSYNPHLRRLPPHQHHHHCHHRLYRCHCLKPQTTLSCQTSGKSTIRDIYTIFSFLSTDTTFLSFIPTPPYDYPITHSTMVLRFNNYRDPLLPLDTSLCLLSAANNIIDQWGSFGAIGTPLEQRSGTVRLKVYPSGGGELSWEKWGTAVRGITEFFEKYEFRDLDFYVLVEGRVIAGGLVSDR